MQPEQLDPSAQQGQQPIEPMPSNQWSQAQPEQPVQPAAPQPTEQWQQPEIVTGEPHAYEDLPSASPIAEDTPTEPVVEAEDTSLVDAEQSSEYSETEDDSQPAVLEGEDEAVRWEASEYIQRDKDTLWYLIFGIVVVVLIAVAIFLIKSLTFAALIPVMAAAIIVMARRPPSIHSYTLSRKGLHIDDQLYSYSEFRSFGLVADDDENSIMLIPRQRFKPGVTVYFPEEVGEVVVDMLAARLPMRQVRLDLIDKAVRFMRIQ